MNFLNVNTDNFLLNAVLNVEIEKARLYEISFKLKISDNKIGRAHV